MADEIDPESSQPEEDTDSTPSDPDAEPRGEDSPENPDETADEDQDFAGDTREELQEKAGELVDKIQEQKPGSGGSDKGGCGWGSCLGCFVLVLLLVGGGGFYLYNEIQRRLAEQPSNSDAVERTARTIMDFRLPGGSRGVAVYRDHVRVAVVENVSRPPEVQLLLYRYPASWPRRLSDLFFALWETYWQQREGLNLEPYRRTSDPLCGQEVWVQMANGETRREEGGRIRSAHLRRACVEQNGNLSCVGLVVQGGSARDVADTVFRSLRCPSP